MWACGVLLAATAVLVQCGQFSAMSNCGPGVATPGVTIPNGDIVIEHGNPLEIFCVLNDKRLLDQGVNSSQLLFYHNGKAMPSAFVHVENSTMIRLYVEKPPPSRSMYYCRLRISDGKEENVCLNSVSVALKPQEVINFTCVSHNWENLTCTWTKPVNYVKTVYSLRFQLPGRAGGRLLYGCPNNTDVTDDKCFWDMTTDPHYRQPYEYYYFKMTGENVLGNVTFPLIKFHHYTHVVPMAPVNLSLINRTTHSVCLAWGVPFPMQVFPPGVIHRVRYQSEWDTRDQWWDVNTAHLYAKSTNQTLDITNLRHANALYDVKVSIKSATAAATLGNEMVWSPAASITVKTKPTVPGAAPKTDVGSFEVSGGLPNRFVYLYWQHIPERLKNGEQFEYRVYRVDEHGVEHLMVPSELTKAYAKFKNITFNSHKFVIVSANREGRSLGHSTIYIPSHSEIPAEPLSFSKIAFGNGTYELSWRPPPERNLTIVNYTIFWCDNERDRPYQCNGYLEWEHVPKGVHLKKINVTEDKIYQFAISANTKTGSSGMVWASCTVIHNKVVGKMKNVWINRIDSRFIEVGWKLDCSDRVGIVTGFLISYCPIVGPQHIECKEPKQNATIEGDPSTMHGRIVGLKPYTTYMVAVAVMTKNGIGIQSEPLLNTTLEAAPETPPRDVEVKDVTNTTIELTWKPPLQTNGLLRFYSVHYNGKVVKVERDKTGVTLTNLTSYSQVSVSVMACTVACSDEAAPEDGVVTTLVGHPSVIDRPAVNFINSTQVSVSWRPPLHPGGPVHYYELQVSQRDGDANTSSMFINMTGPELQIQIPIPDCQHNGSLLTYTFSVRAVNVDSDGRLYPGAWSPAGEGNCYNAAPARNMVVIIWVFAILALTALFLAVAYAGKRLWHRCKVMQDVEVKLPPGLAPMSDKENHIQVHTWPANDGHDGHKTRPPAADEELLLDKVGGRNPSGDSSGCSSGHESVSSSVGTHLSCDSGTEVDQRPPSPDGVFAESAGWECSSLGAGQGDGDAYVRMGKMVSAHSTPNLTDLEEMGVVGAEGTQTSTGYISMPSSEEMTEPAGGYCRVGLDPAAPSRPPVKGYVSIASMAAAAPSPSGGGGGYVSHVPPKAAAYVPLPSLPPDSYCRMGLQGYIPRGEGVGAGGEHATGYVPHTRHNNVFAAGANATSGLCSPTTSV